MTSKRQARQQSSGNVIPPGRLFLSVPEVSNILGLDAQGRTVREAIANGEIPGTRIGPQWHVPVSWVREQLKGGMEAPHEAPQVNVTPEELADMVADRVVSRLVQALTGAAEDPAPRGATARRHLKRALGDGPEAA